MSFAFALFLAAWASSILAQDAPRPVTVIRTLYPGKKNIHHVAGVAYAKAFNQFYLIQEQGGAAELTIVAFSPFEDLLATTKLPGVSYAETNLLFDDQRQQLLIYSRDRQELMQIAVNGAAALVSETLQRTSLSTVAPQQAQGMALDPTGQHLFMLDNQAQQLLRVDADAVAGFSAPQFAHLDLAALGQQDLRGLAIHPRNGQLYLLSFDQQRLHQLTPDGQLVATYDLTALQLHAPQGIIFAPSADQTDPADTLHLFIADQGSASRILEIALDGARPAERTARASVVSLFLANTTDLGQQRPSSPNPSGLTYLPTSNRFLIVDSEVDEMPAYFTGANLFAVTLTGTLVYTGSTQPYSIEPTGAAYNSANGHLFITDDDRKQVFELTAGPDTRFGTGDDSSTSFSTAAFASYDPEGVAFDAAKSLLYLADGINTEIYAIHPGVNGRFDGIATQGGDDVVTSFDLLALGIEELEGVDYDTTTGNLLIVGRSDRDIYEVTPTGQLVRTFNIADVNPERLAGVALAPASGDPAVTHYYAIDRGVDNDVDPTANDGKLYEFTLTPSFGDLLITPRDNGIVGGLYYRDEDILSYDKITGKWSLLFDGSDVGITTDVNAFDILEDGSILMSFEIETVVAGLGPVDDSDIVRFTPTSLGTTTSGAFTWYLDGSDVELTTDSEDIDALSLVSGTLIVSMLGDPVVPGVTGARDEDLLRFTPTQLGETSAGSWELYLDGSDVGLGESNDEDIQGVFVDPISGQIYLSAKSAFTITGLSGDGGDIFICTPTTLGVDSSCTFAPFWDGADHGFGNARLDDLEVVNAQVMRSIIEKVGPITTDPNPPDDGPDDDPGEDPDEEPPVSTNNRLFLPIIRLTTRTTSTSAESAVAAPPAAEENEREGIVLAQPSDPAEAAAGPIIPLTVVRVVDTGALSPALPDPSGVVFIPARNRLLISDSEVDEMPARFTGANLWETTLAGAATRTATTLTYSNEPTGVGFNPANGHLFIADDASDKIFEAAPGNDGLVGTNDDLVTSFSTALFNATDPEDVTYDTTASVLFIVDNAGAEVYRLTPGANGRFDGVAAGGGDDQVTNFDVQGLYIYNPEGIAYEQASNHLFLVANNRTRLYEITTSGALVQLYDTTAANITKNAGVAIAPGSANPAVNSIYVVDSGIDNDIDPTENDGKLIEFSRSAAPTPTPTPTPAVLVGVGDLVRCVGNTDEATANLVDTIPGTVATLGDHVYDNETPTRFANCYESSWGRHKARTKPAAGNHDYHVPGASDYFAYFGAAAGDPQKGYYSYDLGAWHIVVLNSNCDEVGGCKVGSPQEQWLRADLAANPRACTLAYWHHPRFSSGEHGNETRMTAFWQALYDYGADVVLSGHDHDYERFAPQDANGMADPVRGIRQFVVGTGGGSLYPLGTPIANSEVGRDDTFGVLKVSLSPTNYAWEFIPVAGQSFTDQGSAPCVLYPQSNVTPTPTPTLVVTPNSTPTPTGTSTATAINTPTPTPSPTSTLLPTATPTATPTNTPTPTVLFGDLFLSLRDGGQLGTLDYKDEDIVSFNRATNEWRMIFDGSDMGISNDLDAFAVMDDGAILMSFEVETTISNLGLVDDSDIVRFIPSRLGNITTGVFTLYFNASDVGLTTDGEDVDALTLLNGNLLVSTLDSSWVGAISSGDEDILSFTPTQLGLTTTGSWSLYFDGSDVGLNDTDDEDVQGAYVDPATGYLYLSTRRAFSVTGVTGDGADIFICMPRTLGNNTSCTFAPFWDGSAYGLIPETIDAHAIVPTQTLARLSGMGNISADPNDPPPGSALRQIFLPLVHE